MGKVTTEDECSALVHGKDSTANAAMFWFATGQCYAGYSVTSIKNIKDCRICLFTGQ
jgi:hypothetical protein